MLGIPVAKKFKEEGFHVRILARNREKAMEKFDDSFEIFEGTVMDSPRLKNALKGCYGVHISLSGEIEQVGTEHVVEVAQLKTVERVSYISGTSVCEKTIWFPLEKRKFYAEKTIVDSGIAYSIFCPTWFIFPLK